VVREEREKMALDRAQVLVIGDGANDLPMMAEAGTSIAYRAKPLVREQATFCLSYVGLDGVLNLFP
jgi:phosphoserine phosphatase